MGRVLFRLSATLGAAVTALGMLPAVAADAHHVRPDRGGSAHVWLTTPDGTHQLSDEGSVPLTSAPADNQTITVDPARHFQRMTGFGGSLTDSSAAVIAALPRAQRNDVMRELFDPSTGDGLDFLRQPIGASDFVAKRDYTFDDLPTGHTDYRQKHFSIKHDKKTILPLLRQALRINPKITVMATPWSPPAWMKTGQSLVGGRLIDEPRIYHSYALYLLKFLKAYRDAGVPVDYLTVQNEPQNRQPSGYPGTDMSAAQENRVIEALGPMLRRSELHTKLLGYDHNWSEHPDDIKKTPPDEQQDTNNYPQELLSWRGARYLAGTAYHCYAGDPSAMTTLHDEFPTKSIFFTECSGTISSDPSMTFSDTLKFDARTLEIATTRNWAKSVVNWNLALRPDGSPHLGGCDTCTGIVSIAKDGTVTPNAEYYALGHLSRFVQPGAVRIASTSFGTAAWNGQLMDVAFRNPDGSTVLVVHNENDDPRSFSVRDDGRGFDYTLPGGALATFVWRAGRSSTQALDPGDWTAMANPNGPTDPCCTGDVAAHAVDDDASTRWTTGVAQAPGQFLQVDLRTVQRVDTMVLDTGADVGDYPRAFTVTASRTGRHWHRVLSSQGSGQLTSLDLDGRRTRFVRITLRDSAAAWWSVADVRAYR